MSSFWTITLWLWVPWEFKVKWLHYKWLPNRPLRNEMIYVILHILVVNRNQSIFVGTRMHLVSTQSQNGMISFHLTAKRKVNKLHFRLEFSLQAWKLSSSNQARSWWVEVAGFFANGQHIYTCNQTHIIQTQRHALSTYVGRYTKLYTQALPLL